MKKRLFNAGLFTMSLLLVHALPATAADAAPAAASEITVGELHLKAGSLTVSPPDPKRSVPSNASLIVEITNLSDQALTIGYLWDSARLTDDHGYEYGTHDRRDQISGVGKVTKTHADPGYIIEAGQTLRARVKMFRGFQTGQTPGTRYDFSADFVALRNSGEGRIDIQRKYPATFIGLTRASVAEQIGNAPGDIGDSLKKSLGGIFK